MTETEDRLSGRTRRAAKAPTRGKGLKIKRVFTTAGVHPYDEVAYLRFASVYRAFTSLEDFEKEITELRARHLSGGTPPLPGMQDTPPLVRRRSAARGQAATDAAGT